MRLFFAVALAAICTCLPPRLSDAAVISRDWKTPGDGLLTYDTVNKREWLGLSETQLSQFPGSNLPERYQSVVSELAAGGMFAGFSVAVRNDVIAFAESAGVDTTTDDFARNEAPVRELINLLGSNLTLSEERILARGYLDELTEHPAPSYPDPLRTIAELDLNPRVPPFQQTAQLRFAQGSDFVSPSTFGVMLFRRVPEPSTLPFLIVGALWLALLQGRLDLRA
jgi:hypothetical protein